MKLIGIVGSAAEVSTNRQLLNFIKSNTKGIHVRTCRDQRLSSL